MWMFLGELCLSAPAQQRFRKFNVMFLLFFFRHIFSAYVTHFISFFINERMPWTSNCENLCKEFHNDQQKTICSLAYSPNSQLGQCL